MDRNYNKINFSPMVSFKIQRLTVGNHVGCSPPWGAFKMFTRQKQDINT